LDPSKLRTPCNGDFFTQDSKGGLAYRRIESTNNLTHIIIVGQMSVARHNEIYILVFNAFSIVILLSRFPHIFVQNK
jgi:hypothetical protein